MTLFITPTSKPAELVSPDWQVINGHAADVLPRLPLHSVNCIVTSPPYYGLRAYDAPPAVWDASPACDHEWGPELAGRGQSGSLFGSHLQGTPQHHAHRPQWTSAYCQRCPAWRGSLGHEPDPADYIRHLTRIFSLAYRALHPQGVLWLNLGDTYAGSHKGLGSGRCKSTNTGEGKAAAGDQLYGPPHHSRLPAKNLMGIPWRAALALQEAGWILRSDIIWRKPNVQPESVKDRPTNEHEYLFLLVKNPRYYYDHAAIAEPAASRAGRRNRRSVWDINTEPYPGGHFAAFPTALARDCIQAGCPPDGAVLDPFCGSGAAGAAAISAGRRFIGIEISDEYARLARRRISAAPPPLRAAP